MRIAVTGGTGFVGSYLLARLTPDHQLKCWTRSGPPKNFADHPNLEWIPGQLNDPQASRDLVRDCDALVHSGLWRSSDSFRAPENDLIRYLETNLIGSIRLFEAAIEAGVNRIVFVSTCAVHEKILDDRPLDEAHPAWPMSHYGAHKAAIERFVHSYGWGQGISICAIRPTGIYGIQNALKNSKWFQLVSDIVQGKDVTVSGGGKEVHVADVAKGINVLLEADQVGGEVYSCYDQYISQFEVATLAKEFCNSDSTISGESKAPKNQIETGKIMRLGMRFGGQPLLKDTIEEMVLRIQSTSAGA